MGDVIFARPRWEYDSYQDLYSLITLSGYPLIYVDEIDPASDNTYILTLHNGETLNGWPRAKARIILWDYEWRLDGDYPQIPGLHEVWSPDAWYARQIHARFVPCGSHPGLMIGCATDERKYDVAYLAYLTGRRNATHIELRERGLTVSPTSAWGNTRHAILTRSTAMLHVHQHDNIPTIAPLRVALAAAYSMPLIMETPGDKQPLGYSHALYSDWRNLPDFTAMWTRRNEAHILADYGRALHQHLCVHNTFRSYVEAAV